MSKNFRFAIQKLKDSIASLFKRFKDRNDLKDFFINSPPLQQWAQKKPVKLY